jgi:hypothetical protein
MNKENVMSMKRFDRTLNVGRESMKQEILKEIEKLQDKATEQKVINIPIEEVIEIIKSL